ncbi:Transcriptional activator HAP5 [Hyphodiscus hymeniophilus]|uniref:Transcriptional activator HAP5 n=1 Tax=Hyphodiscus hymeniophilus TaxID=353542 RepID=A0A9P6VI55_9HELO|nr:Transcriptional activator HAP5 [Hyphodiscus hymeniophilus]
MDQTQPGASHGQQPPRQQPVYDTNHGGHYGASAALSAQGYAPVSDFYSGAWANVNQGLHGTYKDILTTYWQQIISHLETDTHDYKLHQLPLARIKKVMKADPEVKMISAEAPILFAKGCDIFITELTMRAWIHAEENKRRTLQRSDIASALAKSDMFDFLIDIVPREEASQAHKRTATAAPGAAPAAIPHVQQTQMPPPSYDMGHGLVPDDYRQQQQQPGMYNAVQPQPGAPYGGPEQMYPPQDQMGMQYYAPMGQQQMYQVQGRADAVGQDTGYPRHDNPNQDAEGEEEDYPH